MKTDLEHAIANNIAPWTDLQFKTDHYCVYKDKYAVTEGHLLFVPTKETPQNILECYRAAYTWGQKGVETNDWDGFNVGQNCGKAAGQTVMYPHIHMIPRRHGDMTDPRGGVRHVIPERGKY